MKTMLLEKFSTNETSFEDISLQKGYVIYLTEYGFPQSEKN